MSFCCEWAIGIPLHNLCKNRNVFFKLKCVHDFSKRPNRTLGVVSANIPADLPSQSTQTSYKTLIVRQTCKVTNAWVPDRYPEILRPKYFNHSLTFNLYIFRAFNLQAFHQSLNLSIVQSFNISYLAIFPFFKLSISHLQFSNHIISQSQSFKRFNDRFTFRYFNSSISAFQHFNISPSFDHPIVQSFKPSTIQPPNRTTNNLSIRIHPIFPSFQSFQPFNFVRLKPFKSFLDFNRSVQSLNHLIGQSVNVNCSIVSFETFHLPFSESFHVSNHYCSQSFNSKVQSLFPPINLSIIQSKPSIFLSSNITNHHQYFNLPIIQFNRSIPRSIGRTSLQSLNLNLSISQSLNLSIFLSMPQCFKPSSILQSSTCKITMSPNVSIFRPFSIVKSTIVRSRFFLHLNLNLSSVNCEPFNLWTSQSFNRSIVVCPNPSIFNLWIGLIFNLNA